MTMPPLDMNAIKGLTIQSSPTRARIVVFQDRDEALAAAKQTTSVHENGRVEEDTFSIKAIVDDKILLMARWFVTK